MDNNCILPKLLTAKVFGISQTELSALIESFLIVEKLKIETFTQEPSQQIEGDVLTNWNNHTYCCVIFPNHLNFQLTR